VAQCRHGSAWHDDDASGEWVIDFGGHVIIEGNGITITDQTACDFRLALTEGMTFSYADGMLRIGGTRWVLNLFETKDHKFVRLV
jgi:hypothetical protein